MEKMLLVLEGALPLSIDLDYDCFKGDTVLGH